MNKRIGFGAVLLGVFALMAHSLSEAYANDHPVSQLVWWTLVVLGEVSNFFGMGRTVAGASTVFWAFALLIAVYVFGAIILPTFLSLMRCACEVSHSNAEVALSLQKPFWFRVTFFLLRLVIVASAFAFGGTILWGILIGKDTSSNALPFALSLSVSGGVLVLLLLRKQRVN